MVVRFNFSTFGSDPARLEREFDEYCRRHVRDAVEDNPDLFPDAAFDRIQAPPTINGQLDELFLHARREGIPLYVLIDEYDNFANTILAGEGAEAYHAFTHGGGFFRSFFATLKAGTENGSVERLFVTGVSPVTMDDVTSGFNMGANLSLRARVQRDGRFHRGRGPAHAGDLSGPWRVRPGRRDGAGHHARVVRRLSVREDRRDRHLQHRHGAPLRDALDSQQTRTRAT